MPAMSDRRSSAALAESVKRWGRELGFGAVAIAGTDLAPEEARLLEWLGRGPVETYPDRRRGGSIARWRSTVAGQYVPYVRPQENGGHFDTRWFELTDGVGRGFRVACDRPAQFSATHFRAADLAAASHDVELVPVAQVVVHLDVAHRGLGTASCGPDTLAGYLVGPGTYEWSWAIASPVQ